MLEPRTAFFNCTTERFSSCQVKPGFTEGSQMSWCLLLNSDGYPQWWPCEKGHGGQASRPKHAKPDVPIVRMPDFWPRVATCWFIFLAAQLKVHRIDRQGLRHAILSQWPTEEIAISVSDVLLGPMSSTPCTDFKVATSTKQTHATPNCEDPLPLSYANVMNTAIMYAEELEGIPEPKG